MNKNKSEFFTLDGANIIKTSPDNIEIKVLGKSLNNTKRNGINGLLYDPSLAPSSSPKACVMIAVTDGQAISENAKRNGWNAPPRATIVYTKSGRLMSMKAKTINDLPTDTDLAIGGIQVKPYMDFVNESIPKGVNYKTGHSYIGFDKEKNIYLISKLNHMIKDIVPILDKLKITHCIVLDGGGSTQMKYKGKDIIKSSRAINTAIVLKEEWKV